jgi:hypothetical protein
MSQVVSNGHIPTSGCDALIALQRSCFVGISQRNFPILRESGAL